MKINLVAAVKEEVGKHLNASLLGIGKLEALKSMLLLFDSEDFLKDDPIILNIGTVGSKDFEVGQILLVDNIIDASILTLNHSPLSLNWDILRTNRAFNKACEKFNTKKADVFTSDYFVTNENSKIENNNSANPLCFDMESSVLYTICKQKNFNFLSIKIVSDNLDSSFEEWWSRLPDLADKLEKFLLEFIHTI